MTCRINDFKYKDVVCMKDGTKLGYVGDVELDTETAQLTAIVIYGRYRWMGIFGKEDDMIIKWDDIEMIGEDAILVNYSRPILQRRRSSFWRTEK